MLSPSSILYLMDQAVSTPSSETPSGARSPPRIGLPSYFARSRAVPGLGKSQPSGDDLLAVEGLLSEPLSSCSSAGRQSPPSSNFRPDPFSMSSPPIPPILKSGSISSTGSGTRQIQVAELSPSSGPLSPSSPSKGSGRLASLGPIPARLTNPDLVESFSSGSATSSPMRGLSRSSSKLRLSLVQAQFSENGSSDTPPQLPTGSSELQPPALTDVTGSRLRRISRSSTMQDLSPGYCPSPSMGLGVLCKNHPAPSSSLLALTEKSPSLPFSKPALQPSPSRSLGRLSAMRESSASPPVVAAKPGAFVEPLRSSATPPEAQAPLVWGIGSSGSGLLAARPSSALKVNPLRRPPTPELHRQSPVAPTLLKDARIVRSAECMLDMTSAAEDILARRHRRRLGELESAPRSSSNPLR
eukprot:RCo050847